MNKRLHPIVISSMSIALATVLVSCANKPSEDPLQHTKKLVREGHVSLYENGAFEVPMTTIKLIPAGPSATEFALELAGLRATQSFQLSVQHARETVDFAKAGVKKSHDLAQDIHQSAQEAASVMREGRRLGAEGVTSSPEIVVDTAVTSGEIAEETAHALGAAGQNISKHSVQSAKGINRGSEKAAANLSNLAVDSARKSSSNAVQSSAKHLDYAANAFVKGYAAVPKKLTKRTQSIARASSFDRFVNEFTSSNRWRERVSDDFTDIIVDTTSDYGDNIRDDFARAKRDLIDESRYSGYTLAALKSLRWVLQGIVWDGVIAPAAKVTVSSLGYVATNTVVFPALIVVKEGVVTANVAAEVVWHAGGASYDVVAPTATAAVAATFSAFEVIGGQALAATQAVAGTTAAAGIYAGGKVLAGATAVGGVAAGKTVQYVAVPVAVTGIVVGGTAVGVVAGSVSAVSGAALSAGSATGEVVTNVAGDTLAASTLVVGSVASVGAGAALAGYELAKAVAVPAGYELGAGMVLSYGTLSQLSAQTVLAVADASYVVLSLEGPRWVLYAVKGNIDGGDDLPTGAYVDMNAMQESGETFYRVPASEAEIKKVVDSVYEELPISD